MAITIKDILSIDDFSKVRILAGENELDRIVTSVSVIETPNDAKHVLKNSDEENFKYPGDFNISSLYAYRDNVAGLLELVNILIKDEASALCIIDSYFHELPKEVIEFANERGFAILMIPSDTSYAHVIMQIMEMVIKDQNDLTLELKVKELMNPDNTRVKIRDICQSINRKFYENILVVTMELVHGVKISPAWLWDMFANRKDYLSLRYKNNLLCIFSFKEYSEHLTNNSTHVIIERLSSYDVVSKIGVSSIKRNLEDIQEAIGESEQALGLALCKQIKIIRYDEMGINQLLFPFKSNKEFILFSDRIIEKIEGHDKSSKDTLLKTAKIYVKNNCNMRMTANQLEIHENSVRYRLNQIKECIDPNLSVYELDELLSIGFKIYFLNHKN